MAVGDFLLEDARTAAADIEGLGLHVDVTDLASIADGVRAVEDKWGGIDTVVNNAGIFNMSPIEEITMEDYRCQCDVNVGGTIFVTQTVLPGMKRRAKGGAIINLASQAGGAGSRTWRSTVKPRPQ